jgi:ACS family tartrate transporter-like MFS transporter
MMLLYLTNYLDRVNVGFAALTMNKDLGFSPSIYGFAAGVFFLSYALFQVPANVIIERVVARRSVFCIMATWGALSAADHLAHLAHRQSLRFEPDCVAEVVGFELRCAM